MSYTQDMFAGIINGHYTEVTYGNPRSGYIIEINHAIEASTDYTAMIHELRELLDQAEAIARHEDGYLPPEGKTGEI